MICIHADVLRDNEPVDNKLRARVVIVAETAPASLSISGADVEELGPDYVIAAGSLLITPAANYIAFADGVFTEKE